MKTIFDFIAGNVWWWIGGIILFYILMTFLGTRWIRSGETEADRRKTLIITCRVSAALYATSVILALVALITFLLRIAIR